MATSENLMSTLLERYSTAYTEAKNAEVSDPELAARQYAWAADAQRKLAALSERDERAKHLQLSAKLQALSASVAAKHSSFATTVTTLPSEGDDEWRVTKPEGVTMDDIVGQETAKRALNFHVFYREQYPELYTKLGLDRKSDGMLLTGAPGNGKTMLAKAVANTLHASFYEVHNSDILQRYLGDSEHAIKRLFETARAHKPAVIFIDEISGIAPKATGENGAAERIVNELLAQLDGFEDNTGVYVMAATNDPWRLNEALLRPGRLGSIVYVGPPNEQARFQLLTKQLAGMELEPDVSLSFIAKNTEYYSGADIVEFCRHLKYKLLERAIHYTEEGQNPSYKLAGADMNTLLKRFKPSCTPEQYRIWDAWAQTAASNEAFGRN